MRIPVLLLATLTAAGPLAAQLPERAVRRTIPITNAFQRGLQAGTRDSTGRPGANYWQLRTDYSIDTRLDPVTGIVSGRETVTITNPSDSALTMLAIRLDQNMFTPKAPRSRPAAATTSGMTITRMKANGRDINVDSLSPLWNETTLVRVRLETPIAAGGTGTLEVSWAFKVPVIPEGTRGDRMGAWGNKLFQQAQWYPRVANYDDLRGWDRDPYMGGSEFYNNFGKFDVRIDVPAGWLVGATGQLVNSGDVLTPMVLERLGRATESDSQIVIVGPDERAAGTSTVAGSRLVWHFVADSVADFAWAASNEYVWDATRATIPGRGPIPIYLLYLPENGRYKQTGAMARHALEFYSNLWMPYAWPVFTQVDGPEGGMEYPMLTMSGPGFGVTDHEIGHQWWPMMVGVNETWYGWMDEGFNSYMNILSGAAYQMKPAELNGVGQRYGRISGNESETNMMTDANYDGPMYSFTTYGKAPMMLSMLGGIVGDSNVTRAMSNYAKTWRFKHPSPWDFMFAMNREFQMDLGWFWYYWLFTTESSDGSIASVTNSGGKTYVTVKQAGEMPAPVILQVEFAADGPAIKPMANAVVTGNTALVTYPVDVWFSGSRSFVAELNFGGRKIERVTYDPERRFPDNNPADNTWPAEAAQAPTTAPTSPH
ncbi:MAG: M1 family metallopeptidase [Gemmatimonadales bacterium]